MTRNQESQWSNLVLIQRPENHGATGVEVPESENPRPMSSNVLAQGKVDIPVPPKRENSASLCFFVLLGLSRG